MYNKILGWTLICILGYCIALVFPLFWILYAVLIGYIAMRIWGHIRD